MPGEKRLDTYCIKCFFFPLISHLSISDLPIKNRGFSWISHLEMSDFQWITHQNRGFSMGVSWLFHGIFHGSFQLAVRNSQLVQAFQGRRRHRRDPWVAQEVPAKAGTGVFNETRCQNHTGWWFGT